MLRDVVLFNVNRVFIGHYQGAVMPVRGINCLPRGLPSAKLPYYFIELKDEVNLVKRNLF